MDRVTEVPHECGDVLVGLLESGCAIPTATFDLPVVRHRAMIHSVAAPGPRRPDSVAVRSCTRLRGLSFVLPFALETCDPLEGHSADA
jgi:hypothetical protein